MAKIDSEDWSAQEAEFAEFLASLCEPPSTEPTEVWAEKHVEVQDGPFAGSKWRLQFTLLAKFIFDALRRPGMKRVIIMMSAQYVKTTVLLIDFLRNCKEDPANTMWVMAEADNITEFASKRLIPYIESCDVVAPMLVSTRKNIIQMDGMNLMLRGSNSRAKLQSDPVRRIYCDERREWAKGAIDLLRKRMRTFPNAMEISAGTAGVENDELHCDYKEGSQTRGHIRCLHCQHSQPIRFNRDATAHWPLAREFGGFVWESSDVTKPNGIWNYVEVAKTVRFECENPQCRALYSNNQKYDLLRTMHPHDYNPNAPKDISSFSGCAFEAIWDSCDWDKLVVEFLKAVEEAKRGNLEPLKAFITETLGEPWRDSLGVIEDAGWLETRKAPYDFGDVFPEEQRRFMAADKQEKGGEHYWWLIRAFGFNGASRLIAYGKCNTKTELEEIRKSYKVIPACCVIDSGFQAQEVYRFCLATGWKAFKGDSVEYYLVQQPGKRPGEMVTMRQIWRKTKAAVYNSATKKRIAAIPLYTFASDAVKDALAEYKMGLVGDWSVPDKIDKLYIKHLSAERREEKTDPRGRVSYVWKQLYEDNHLGDCEIMIHVAAIASKTISLTPKGKAAIGSPSQTIERPDFDV
jgi:phage terminase large subunit GpA-like protein